LTLRELRESRLLTQQEVADACGVRQGTVSGWERGEQRPQFPQLRKLAELFHLSSQEIVKVIDETMAKKDS
jgi:transcriptional regulator with XRE-family HTH domain